jgi:hypothetical protein
LDWFWLVSERRRARGGDGRSPRAEELVRRAELARELAERARYPVEPFVHGDGEALACELYRQAVYWALLAQTPIEPASDGSLPFASLWDRTDPDVLARAASGADAALALREALATRTFADFAELDRAARVALATRCARFTLELLTPLRTERRQVARIWRRRLLRLGGVAFVLLGGAIVALRTVSWNHERRDLARRATWSASSDGGYGGCRAPEQTCPESAAFFFHTRNEHNPFIVFDLGRERSISQVSVDNRLDCCTDRARRLVLEVSKDQVRWKSVARQDEPFTTWKVEVVPRLRTRYVRLRVDGTSILHLSRVRILP